MGEQLTARTCRERDLGCGVGRYTIELAPARLPCPRRYRMTSYLDRARDRAQEAYGNLAGAPYDHRAERRVALAER